MAEQMTVTPDMIAAGRAATRVEDDCPPDELMARIYCAMRAVEPHPLAAKPETTPSREEIDALFRAADVGLIDDLGQAIARGCVAYDVRLPVGCLTSITKSVLFMLDQRRKHANG